ncbi:39S ribosomal protein L28-like protein [Leptotrombidium deliense]|uniref:Large ribosomal subunit protein bL28m n=1 Tax=Leptotrombidium deliense TaxID=299467 RepID=A0A443SAW9_9ACAR|nr:39S ribosomal protein L28-like protein [Leptotrombidium deliense]
MNRYRKLYFRLPAHYRKLQEDLQKPSTRVHDEPEPGELVDYYLADKKRLIIRRKPDVPIKVEYPVEADQGLWGGEGVIRGFFQPRKFVRKWDFPIPRVWLPNLKRAVVYSEILDKYFSVVLTETTLKLIDKSTGFDNYILRTPVQDFKSQLALDLRRKMLVSLAKKDFAKDDPIKFDVIWKKYGDCAIPLEEAEWFGLPIPIARAKQAQLEAKQNPPIPLKIKYASEFLQKLDGIYNNNIFCFENIYLTQI